MSCGGFTFFGIVRTPLVRHGGDAYLESKGVTQHYRMPVYKEMLLQICRDYQGLPDSRTLTAEEIRFFYEGLRHELKEGTKPK